MEGRLSLHGVGFSADSVQVAEQGLTSALCLNNVRVFGLTCSEGTRALQAFNEPSNVEKRADSRPGHATLQGTG